MFFAVSKEKSYTLEHKGNTSSFGLTNTPELTPVWGFYSSNVFLGTGVDFRIIFLWSLPLDVEFFCIESPVTYPCKIRGSSTPLALDSSAPAILPFLPCSCSDHAQKVQTIKRLTVRRMAECDPMYFLLMFWIKFTTLKKTFDEIHGTACMGIWKWRKAACLFISILRLYRELHF